MKNTDNNPLERLPLAFISELLADNGQLSESIYMPFREIFTNREKLREQLLERSIIQEIAPTEEQETATTCGIDGYNSVEKLLNIDLVCCAAFAVEGLIPLSGEKRWESPCHRSLLRADRYNADINKIASAIRMQMEIELAASSPQVLVFYDGSFITQFAGIMDNLPLALKLKESQASQEYISRIKISIQSFETILTTRNTKKVWAGMPSNSYRNDLTAALQWQQDYSDTILFTILLSPGEFTAPMPVDRTELSRVKSLPIKDEKFGAVIDSLISEMNNIEFLYYRPYKWTPVLRIEIARSVSQDPSRLSTLLNGIQYQCHTPGIPLPYPLYSAGKMSQSMGSVIPLLRKMFVSHITNAHKGDVDEISSLLMFKDLCIGDYNE